MPLIFLLRKLTKRLYPYRGLSRVADLVRKVWLHSPRQYLIRDFDGDLSFHCALNEHISSQVFWRGAYSADQLFILRRLLKPGMVFVDAGANKGEFTVLAAKYTEGGKVLAFEPVAAVFEELKANVSANGFQHVQLIRKGLGKASGERVIYHAENKRGQELNMGTYTLYPRAGMDIALGSISVITLDDFVKEEGIGRVDVIKIDIEGGEREMLLGALETIRRWKPVIFIEVNEVTSRAAGYGQGAIVRLLEELGYRCERVGRRGKTSLVREKDLKKFQNLIALPGQEGGIAGQEEGIGGNDKK